MTERVDQMLAALPRGKSLDDSIWVLRHRLLLCLLAGHIPGLYLFGVLQGRAPMVTALEVLPLAVCVGVGVLSHSRLVRSTAVTLGLVYSASALVHLTGGRIEAHFHYFVVLGFAALYQDWRPYLVAVGYVVIGHGLAGVLFPEIMMNDPLSAAEPWRSAAILGGFVLAACGAHILFWKATERQQRAAHEYYSKLYEGERAVVAQLRQAQMVKDELISVVGHEFRTPLTAIQGFARTLDARFDRMDRDSVQTCTQAIERESKRLTRMVANLLSASEDITPTGTEATRLDQIAARVVHDVGELAPMAVQHVRVHVAEDHIVRMKPDHTHQLLFNLLDNAVKFATPDSDVRVSSKISENMVVLEVANVGPPLSPADRERIFDAFVQGDSSDTRRYGGIGLGLHIARKVVTSYGGRIGAYAEGPVVIFRAWLPLADEAHARVVRVDAGSRDSLVDPMGR